MASAAGLDVIALTDHDTAAGVPDALRAAAGCVHVIPGIEISTMYDSGELHMLGYFIDVAHPGIVRYQATAAQGRRARMQGMLDRLETLGIEVEYEEVVRAAGSDSVAIGRPHLARALVKRGFAHSFADAFERYIGDRGPAYLPTQLLTPCQAIDLIHTAGGLAVWAHPRIALYQRDIRLFTKWGLDGVECFRPRCPPDESITLESTARSLGLLVTGGSDWHGDWHGPLGDFSMSMDEVGAFLERGGI